MVITLFSSFQSSFWWAFGDFLENIFFGEVSVEFFTSVFVDFCVAFFDEFCIEVSVYFSSVSSFE